MLEITVPYLSLALCKRVLLTIAVRDGGVGCMEGLFSGIAVERTSSQVPPGAAGATRWRRMPQTTTGHRNDAYLNDEYRNDEYLNDEYRNDEYRSNECRFLVIRSCHRDKTSQRRSFDVTLYTFWFRSCPRGLSHPARLICGCTHSLSGRASYMCGWGMILGVREPRIFYLCPAQRTILTRTR